jgi:hypothetical protein
VSPSLGRARCRITRRVLGSICIHSTSSVSASPTAPS